MINIYFLSKMISSKTKEFSMNLKNQKIIFKIVVFGIISLSCPSVAKEKNKLITSQEVKIECEQCGNIHVANVYIYQKGDRIEVVGTVKRKCNLSTFDKGYIDVIVFSPDGTVLEQVCTSYVPHIIPRRGRRESRFTASLSTIPPLGSTIHIKPCCHFQ
jgi:hypothetical protein